MNTKAEAAKYSQVNLGAEYDLSKRTVLYTIAAWEHAIGTDSTGKPAVAALAFVTPSSTDKPGRCTCGNSPFLLS